MANQRVIRAGVTLALLVFLALSVGALQTFAQSPLRIGNVQILNINSNCVCQHIYDNATGQYRLAWQSAPLEGLYLENHYSVRLGDIDNDGVREIVASVKYSERTETIKVGKRTTTQTWGLFRVEVFEDGAEYGGGPTWFFDIPGEVRNSLPNDSEIADIDNDGDRELVLIRSTELDTFHFFGQGLAPVVEHLWTNPSFLTSLEVGDADNDAKNELIVVPGNSSSIKIWKHNDDHSWGQTIVDPVPSSLWGQGMSYCGVPYVRVRNADNVAGNEIIATGNNQRLMVWKYDGAGYRLVSWSQELVASMACGIDSGDLDGDGESEVVIDLWGARKYPARLVVLAFENGGWVVRISYNSFYGDQRDLLLADPDADGSPEVAVNNHGIPGGLKILEFVGTNLAGGTFQEVHAAPGYGYMRVEIR